MLTFKDFIKETTLSNIMKKNKDPMKFALDVTKAQRSKNVKITKKRGAASTRELVHAFLRYKNRKRNKNT